MGMAHQMAATSSAEAGSGETAMENKDTPSATIPISAEEAEVELEALDLPPNLAGWIDRLPEDLLAAIDIIENEGGGGCWLVCEKKNSACLALKQHSGHQCWTHVYPTHMHFEKLLHTCIL
jgi:hypothetical protein